MVSKSGQTLNLILIDKYSFSLTAINFLGYSISADTIKPDEEYLRLLLVHPVPRDVPSFLQGIPNGILDFPRNSSPRHVQKVSRCLIWKWYPLKVLGIYCWLSSDCYRSRITVWNGNWCFRVHFAASLSHSDRPVACFARTLTGSKQKHCVLQTENYASVEALGKWRHYLTGKQFRLLSDQSSVAFMFAQIFEKNQEWDDY